MKDGLFYQVLGLLLFAIFCVDLQVSYDGFTWIWLYDAVWFLLIGLIKYKKSLEE